MMRGKKENDMSDRETHFRGFVVYLRQNSFCPGDACNIPEPMTRSKLAMMDIVPRQDFPRKRCTGECKQEYPATTDYFYPQRSSKDGLTPQCRECNKASARYR